MDGLADYRHGEFGTRLDRSWLSPYGYYTSFDNHGTHVAGIIGAALDGKGTLGVAPRVSLSNVAVFDSRGWVTGATTTAAIARVVADGARVVNMSYGPVVTGDLASPETLRAITTYRNQTVAVLAAGNSGVALKNEPWSLQSAPLNNLIIVGSVDSNKVRSSFSNVPGEACFTTRQCLEADKFKYRFLMAPGGRWIPSTAPGNRYLGIAGTSMAAPHVAGAAALLISKWPFLTPDQTVDILFKSAEDLGQKGVDPIYGWGLLRVDRAVSPIGQTRIATGNSVTGKSASASTTRLITPTAMGNSRALKSAMRNAVVFDDLGRDFQADASQWTYSHHAALDLSRHFSRLSPTGEQTVISQPLAPGLTLTSLSTPALRGEQEGFGVLEPSAEDKRLARMPAWRLDKQTENLSLSLGKGFSFSQALLGTSSEPLFLSDEAAPELPLLGLARQNTFAMSRIQLTNTLAFATGFSELSDSTLTTRNAQGTLLVARATYTPSERVEFSLTQTVLDEKNMTLGSPSAGALTLGKAAHTVATGVAMTVKPLPSLRAQLHLTEAVTRLEGSSDSLFRSVDNLPSRSYGGSLVKTGVFKATDELGLSLTKPLRVNGASAALDVPVGRTDQGTVLYEHRRVNLEPEGSQTDIELSYRGKLGQRTGFGVNLFHQDQFNHERGERNTGASLSFKVDF
ncbi:subtilase family protein [Pseudomonas duriflava]|uniref:Subtilase family protein n=1 Tax=Pseudomonas duriflava TaxID=459528 RepID=A0A562QAK7_9PSED|nr:subtilase family protein [Pseudomonas duriflava]